MARLDHARALVRRFQLVVGLGFGSCVVGLLLTLAIATRLRDILPALPPTLALVAVIALRQLWEYAVLPASCYAAARVIPMSPWKTALGAAATGELFLLALDSFTGMGGAWFQPPLAGILRLVSLGGGVWLSAFAMRRARRSAERAEKTALEAAERKKSEYDAFVREAERIAALRDGAAPPAAETKDTGTDPG